MSNVYCKMPCRLYKGLPHYVNEEADDGLGHVSENILGSQMDNSEFLVCHERTFGDSRSSVGKPLMK